MPYRQRAHHHLHQVLLAWLQLRQGGTDRPQQLAIDCIAPFQGEQVDTQLLVAQMFGLLRNDPRKFTGPVLVTLLAGDQGGQAGVGTQKQMIMHLALTIALEVFRAKISGRLERHVAGRTVLLGQLGIIKSPRAMPGNTRKQVGIVVILPPCELLVVVQGQGQRHLVAGGAELRRFVNRFQEGLLVEIGFG